MRPSGATEKLIAGLLRPLHPRVTFDRSPPWLRPFGRTEVRPISLPAKLCFGQSHHKFVGNEFEQAKLAVQRRGPGMGRVKPSCPGRLRPQTSRVPRVSVGLRRCADGTSLSRLRTCGILSAPLRARLRPFLDARSPTGLNSNNTKLRRLYRAPYGEPEWRKPLLAPSLLRRPNTVVLLCRRNGGARPNGCKRAFSW